MLNIAEPTPPPVAASGVTSVPTGSEGLTFEAQDALGAFDIGQRDHVLRSPADTVFNMP